MKIIVGLVVALIASVASAQPDEREASILQAIELHDRGEFDAAIRVYESLLAETPDDAELLYEIALSYQSKGDYAKCIEFATLATAKPGRAQAEGFSVMASCHDDAGRPKDAVATFKRGLKVAPRDVMLNLNYGLTLFRLERPAEAQQPLTVAIDAAPGFASPYRVYALTLDQQHHQDSALLMRLRFLFSEPDSERSIDAARLVVATFNELLAQGKLEEEKGKSGEGTPADSFVRAMQSFVATHIKPSPERPDDTPWRQVAQALAVLSEREVLPVFLYHVAALGRVEGAAPWVNQNPEQLQKLLEAIRDYHANLERP